MTASTGHRNPRYVLRAYETADASRLAVVMLGLPSVTDRSAMIRAWGAARPQDLRVRARGTIRHRVGQCLALFSVAGIVERDGEQVTVLDRSLLEMAARNLTILEGPDMINVPPSAWKAIPEVPEDLRPAQERLCRTHHRGPR